MKKFLVLAVSLLVMISFFGCNHKIEKSGSIKACDGYFDVSAEDLLTKINANIKANDGKYPVLPDYSDQVKNGELTEYYSYFDQGACLLINENSQHKVVAAMILLNINKATEQGADYSGYYSTAVAYTINPNLEAKRFESIDVDNLAVHNIQSVSCGNFFCINIRENEVQQFMMYPLPNS